jgi:hypothetical protein
MPPARAIAAGCPNLSRIVRPMSRRVCRPGAFG